MAGTVPAPGRRGARAGAAAAIAALACLALAGCTGPAGRAPSRPAARASSRPAARAPSAAQTDPHTVRALVRAAQAFNNAYDNGDFGAVYDRWDARSKGIISRAEYIRRHRLCAPATHATAVVTGADQAPGGAWHVHYRLSGQQLTDTWFYVRHRWVFDIVLSNPDAARLYRLPFARYAAAVGCLTH